MRTPQPPHHKKQTAQRELERATVAIPAIGTVPGARPIRAAGKREGGGVSPFISEPRAHSELRTGSRSASRGRAERAIAFAGGSPTEAWRHGPTERRRPSDGIAGATGSGISAEGARPSAPPTLHGRQVCTSDRPVIFMARTAHNGSDRTAGCLYVVLPSPTHERGGW